MKLTILTNIPTPYRESLFRAVARHCELRVLYCSVIERNREWRFEFGGGYEYDVLHGLTLGTGLHVDLNVMWAEHLLRADAVIIGGYSYPTLWLARTALVLRRIPYFLWFDGAPNTAGAVQRRILAFMLKQSRGVIATHHGVVQEVSAVRSVPSAVVPLTVDVGPLLRTEPGDNSGTILYAGRLVREKRVDVAIDALRILLAEHPTLDVRLDVVGSGPLRNELERQVQANELQARVRFHGFLQPGEMRNAYWKADVLLLPSEHESWGAVVNEALAAGVIPVVSERCGAASLIATGESGYVVPFGDARAIAEILAALYQDEGLMKSVKKGAVDRGRRCTPDVAAAQIVSFIEERIKRDRGTARATSSASHKFVP